MVVDPNGAATSPGEVGELRVSLPFLMTSASFSAMTSSVQITSSGTPVERPAAAGLEPTSPT